MTRLPNWHITLDSFFNAHMVSSFTWGSNDCSLFAANVIQTITGVDIADDFRGKYTDQASAFALIKSVTGGTTVADAIAYCTSKHGIPEWTTSEGKPLPLMARRGDLVAVSNDNTIIAGVIDLSGCYATCMGESGIVHIPASNIIRAWRIG